MLFVIYLCIVFLKHITALSRSERIYMKGHFSDSKSRAFPRWTSDIFGGPWFINTATKIPVPHHTSKNRPVSLCHKNKQTWSSSGLSSRIRKTLETNCGKRIRWKWICHLGWDFSIEPEDCASGEKCGEKLDEKSQWLDWIHRIHPRFGLHNLSVLIPAQSPYMFQSFSKLICFVTNILFDLYIFFLLCRLWHRSWGWAWLLF